MNSARAAIPILLRASRCAMPMAPRPLRTPKKVIYGSAPSPIQTQSRFYSQDSSASRIYSFEEVQSARAYMSTVLSNYTDQESGRATKSRPCHNWYYRSLRRILQPANVVLTDVREPSELNSTGRIPSSISIPVGSTPDSFFITEEEFEDRFGYSRPGTDKEVIFYCKAGVRSKAAAELARQAGWKKIGEYPGSWLDWTEKGGPTEK
ncbi:hypothetical protein BP5796_02243 [Coleophoma crateriformis]|uniref:Rhodanese domain-containing protein n=1 Tax=Coleophoma crateriformis TaxID=565419 RepID=A0A3D8SZ84_9HELO|nr:hypothetical protein BP5796_02243 [Coleophoma crateriformis]